MHHHRRAHHQPAVNAARLADPQKTALLDVGDDQTDLVDVCVEQQVRDGPAAGGITWQTRLLWTVRWQAPKPSQSLFGNGQARFPPRRRRRLPDREI